MNNIPLRVRRADAATGFASRTEQTLHIPAFTTLGASPTAFDAALLVLALTRHLH